MRGRFLHRQPPPGSRVDTQHPLGHGCVGWWEANMGSGLVVPDISGQNNHGTMTNMDAATDWAQGRRGGEGALEFDGLNDAVGLPTVSQTLTTLSTVTSIYPTSWANTAWPHIVCQRDAGSNRYALNADPTSARIDFRITTDDVIGFATFALTDLPINTWHHVVSTYDDGGDRKPRAYIGGVEVTYTLQTAATGNIIAGTNIEWCIGNRYGDWARPFEGSIDMVSIYSRALPAEEAAHLYANPYAPIWTPGERKWWWMGAAGGAYYYDHITRRIRGLI